MLSVYDAASLPMPLLWFINTFYTHIVTACTFCRYMSTYLYKQFVDEYEFRIKGKYYNAYARYVLIIQALGLGH